MKPLPFTGLCLVAVAATALLSKGCIELERSEKPKRIAACRALCGDAGWLYVEHEGCSCGTLVTR